MESIVKKTKLYLFDMDGTLYLGNRLYSFTKELLSEIRRTGGKYLFMTNNSSKSVADYVKKLEKLGIDATTDDFLTSSQATAYYLNQNHPGKKLYVCGTRSLVAELESEGFSVTTDIDETECVVMGFDTELTFQKLWDVSKILLTKKDIPYIATNPDLVCPTEFGSVPDCGSICYGIKNATGREPIVIGKPSALMPTLAMERWGYSKEETAVIGDRIYTDIRSGLNAGVTGILVLSGESTLQTLEASPDKPHLVLQDAGELLPYLRQLPTV
ncbi:MAG: HAD-IIA family hydrolase [Ruminococcaceae bacterium]|nr:HAD-IIA family hydrolase [Oscillospiraceae bacterium]